MSVEQAQRSRRLSVPLGLFRNHWHRLPLAALFIVFVLQNAETVDLDYLGLHFNAPLWLVAIAAAGTGAIIGWTRQTRRHRA